MPYKRKLLKQLSIFSWVITLTSIAFYFFILVPHSFSGWKDYVTYHLFFILLFLSTERVLLPWIIDRLHQGFWICVYPFLIQFILIFLLVLLISVLAGGLVIDDGWDIINLWQAIVPLLLPNALAIVLFLGRFSFTNWQERESYRIQLRNQELVPHFLNSTMTKLRPLIVLIPSTAISFVTLNTRMLHFYLKKRENLSISIQEELEQVKIRIQMQEIGRQKPLCLLMKIDDSVLPQLVPTMLLVNLIENCFFYGVLHDPDKPIQLHIHQTQDERISIQISNAIKSANKKNTNGTATSLKRCQELLRHLDPYSSFEIIQTEFQFTIRLHYCISI